MQVTLVGSSWDVVAGDQTGVDFIPMIEVLWSTESPCARGRAFSGRVFALVILTSLKYCECLLVSSLIGELTEVPAF